MASQVTLNVSLTPELGEFVSGKVASGRYLSASEVVRDGLRLLEKQDQVRAATLAEVRAKIAVGLASLDRGNGLDGEEVFDELDLRYSDQLVAARG